MFWTNLILFTSSLVGISAHASFCDRLLGMEPDQYVHATARSAQNASQLGVPALLKGLHLRGMVLRFNSYLAGASPFGAIEIKMSGPGDIWVRVHSLPGQRGMDSTRLDILRELFPELRINGETREGLNLVLQRQSFAEGERFAEAARSLVNTLLNDPGDLLGAKPSVRLPMRLRVDAFVAANLEFFKQFGPFTVARDGSWIGALREHPGAGRPVTLSVNLYERKMSLTVDPVNERASRATADVRRVQDAIFRAHLEAKAPTLWITETGALSIRHLEFARASLDFIAFLIENENDPRFEKSVPLTPEQSEFAKGWRARHLVTP